MSVPFQISNQLLRLSFDDNASFPVASSLDMGSSISSKKIARVSLRTLPSHAPPSLLPQKVRRQEILTRNRARVRLNAAFEKLTPSEKRNAPLWKRCENYIWRLTSIKLHVCKIDYRSLVSQPFCDAARHAIFILPYEVSEETAFWKKFLIIKNRHIQILNEIGKNLMQDSK